MSTDQQRFWLMKTEPDVFSFGDLLRAPQKTAPWEGVRNYQARNFMRDDFQIGNDILIYHSSCAEPGIAGLARVVREAYPDPTALDPKSKYFDPMSAKKQESRWCMVDVQAVREFKKILALRELRDDPQLADMLLLKRGMRLSIQPVTQYQWDHILTLAEKLA